MELVAHRAGNHPEAAARAVDLADMVELDLHVLRGRVEARHAKVLRPTSRLWERWYLLPPDARGVPVEQVLAVLPPATPLMLDLKCFTVGAAKRIGDSVPTSHPIVASSRSWWVLPTFRKRSGAVMLRSCASPWQLRLALALPGLGQQVGIVAHHRLLNQQAIGSVKEKTPLLYSWAIPNPARGQELVDHGVTGLIVDDLDQPWRSPD